MFVLNTCCSKSGQIKSYLPSMIRVGACSFFKLGTKSYATWLSALPYAAAARVSIGGSPSSVLALDTSRQYNGHLLSNQFDICCGAFGNGSWVALIASA